MAAVTEVIHDESVRVECLLDAQDKSDRGRQIGGFYEQLLDVGR